MISLIVIVVFCFSVCLSILVFYVSDGQFVKVGCVCLCLCDYIVTKYSNSCSYLNSCQ